MNNKIHIRPFQVSDAENLTDNANNPNVAKYLREQFPSPYTIEHAKHWIEIAADNRTGVHHAVVLSNSCIGSVGATFGKNEHRYTAELGYWLGESYWGRGLTTQAVGIFVRYLYENFTLNRVFAAVPDHNVASFKVLQKSGFAREAIFQNNLFIREHVYDEHIYAIYRESLSATN